MEEDLRKRVFTLVENLANGFAERPENHIGDTDEDRSKLYENCLIFLYRLLFILYAEGRNLLPVEPRSRKYYKELSLARLINPLKNFSEFDSRTRTRLYQDIQELCHLINGTDEKKNKEYSVPRYNGGLFDPDKYSALERWRVCDAGTADVLRGLLFNPLPDPQQPALPIETVDFGDLRVQQLGSIYEGLLEHHFALENGRLTLKTDKAERKATGTYYTPDYIVKYIVEQTVAPLLAEIESREPVKTSSAASKKDNSFANEVLKVNICDPAMGSGHFLVEATTYLADQIVYHPTTKFQAEFVKGESQEETEIAFWRRRVVEVCIYGVDLNPLAVELAKLSLWLTTIFTDQPLNFLDHHLCCGNSLIGARLEDLSHVPARKLKSADRLKLSWKITENLRASLTRAVQMVHNIEGGASASVSDVKSKEKLWLESVRPALLPFRTVANLWAACFFGNELPQNDYEALIELLDIHPDKIRPWQNAGEFQGIVMEAVKKGSLKLAGREFDINQLKALCAFLFRSERSAGERRFFHWELEFPEVFFNADGTPRERPGFDAVVGNPPWGMLQPHNTEESVLLFLRSFFECSEFKVDMFQLFLEQSLRLLGLRRQLGMIVPNTLLTNTYCKRIRELFQRQTAMRFLAVTAEMIFKDADVHPAILVVQKTQQASEHRNEVAVLVHETAEPFEQVLARRSYTSLLQEDIAAFDASTWNVRLDSHFARMVRNLVGQSERLRALGCVKRGLISGNREKYFATEKRGPKWYPIVTGTDVQRYGIEPPMEYVLFEKPGRTAGGCWDEDVHLTRGKILLKQVGRWPQAAVDDAPYCITGNVFAIVLKDSGVSPYYVTSILNSRLTKVVWSVVLSDFKAVFPELKGEWIEQWPVRRIEFNRPEKSRASLLAKSNELYQRGVSDGNPDGVLAFVSEQLAARPERADVVHDLLAFLAEQMMALNREKRAAVKQFLTDLKDFHGFDAHALKPKTKLNEFWKLEAAEVFAHFRANKLRLKDSDEEKIRSRFQKAKDKLVPLESSLALTDDLIDEIVYRLYALSPDEIKLVKETSRL